jgi:hypothetical protein
VRGDIGRPLANRELEAADLRGGVVRHAGSLSRRAAAALLTSRPFAKNV